MANSRTKRCRGQSDNIDGATTTTITSKSNNPAANLKKNENQKIALNFPVTHIKRLDIGSMNQKCLQCNAKFWVKEKLAKSSVSNPEFSVCCRQGKVKLDPISQPPDLLQKLLLGNHQYSAHFKANIRRYNSSLAFTSVGVKLDKSTTGNGVYQFRMQGGIYHQLGPLYPQNNEPPKFAQIYIHDTEYQLTRRMELFNELNPELLKQFQAMMLACNPYVNLYKDAATYMQDKSESVKLVLRHDRNYDPRRYNLPTASEIAVLMPDEQRAAYRDIVLHKTLGGIRRISQFHPLYDPLHYVLLHPNGDQGYHTNMPFHSDFQDS